MKMKIGIIFGGFSKEREISFAGGRTVYDNLNKSLFEPIPIFIDSFGNFILLDWQYVYKGSIRDFYPPAELIPKKEGGFQIYAESLGNLNSQQQEELILKIGKKILIDELKNIFDFAFLCLHGPYGEDGKIQGLFESLGIPYSGSGILPSAIGIDKAIQKKLMKNAGFPSPKFGIIKKEEWLKTLDKKYFFEKLKKEIGDNIVVKSVSQGSSIGISVLQKSNFDDFIKAVNKSFFITDISMSEWRKMDDAQKNVFVRTLTDIREGIGIPVRIANSSSKISDIIYHPQDLIFHLNKISATEKNILLESLDGEHLSLIEEFISGKEFSCIVLQNEDGNAVALPPTEIIKGGELFDYRSKYLPGLSRKITPINLPDSQIQEIRKACEHLFTEFNFDVYARIDGFINEKGVIYLNDPNTTSGMMPSSFFFHQAAEIGLNPSQFLTFIIRTSLSQRALSTKNSLVITKLLRHLDEEIKHQKNASTEKIKVAVILGGYSSERHISVESGRNIYEKLASSSKYKPVPIFLTGNENEHIMYRIPVNILLKDNADDIKEKIAHYKIHPIVKKIMEECVAITEKYGESGSLDHPEKLNYSDLPKLADVVFIALHGRPGEDGAVQEKLEKINLPYNGSDTSSSQITIDKFRTNEILKENGFLIAEHLLVSKNDWNTNKNEVLENIRQKINFPFIAKPVDDGCSSAVKKIKNEKELEAFATLIFRNSEEFNKNAAETLHIKVKEEFPQKNIFLIEELISKKDAPHFLEITGGMLTKYDRNGNVEYEVFEASEALSEGEVLSLEEKFLAGQGQNITPARYSVNYEDRKKISEKVKNTLGAAAKLLHINGYTRIDAFVRIYNPDKVEVIFIEVNSLPGMTPATCIFHQAAINNYKPYDFIDKIIDFAFAKKKKELQTN